METFLLDHDIQLLCIQATSFPDGIAAAHEKVQALAANPDVRFGISCPDVKGIIQYKAAAGETYTGEANEKGCETFTIPKGEYICTTIHNYKQDEQSIGRVFRELIAQPGINPRGFCLEWYLNETDVRCMVPLRSKK